MNKVKKYTLVIISCVLIILVVLFLFSPEIARELFSLTKPGTVISSPGKTEFVPGKSNAKSLDPNNTKIWDELFEEWGNLQPKEKEKFDQLANDLILESKWAGITVLPKSNQDKSNNLYYRYAFSRIQNLNNPQKLHGDWLEEIFKCLPLFLQYSYAYEHKADINIAKQVLPTMLNEYFSNKISLYEMATYLHLFQRYPSEANQLLPVAIFLVKRDFQKLIQNNNNIDIACGFAVYCALQKLMLMDENEIKIVEVVNKIKLGDSVFERAETAKYVLAGLYTLSNTSIKLPDEFLILAKTLAYQLMMVLEPDGCLAQLGLVTARVNYRETLFYASEIFKTNDLKFVAQGAFRNDDCNKPLKNEIFIKNCGYFAAKSSWNLQDLIPDQGKAHNYQHSLGPDASQFTFDILNQEISFFAYSKPQIKIKVKGIKLDIKTTNITYGVQKEFDKKQYVVDEIEFGNGSSKITFIRDINAFILVNENANLSLSIKTYRSQIINDVAQKTIKTIHKVSPMIFYNYTHEEKHKGDCYLKGEFQLGEFDQSEDPHMEEGYYNLIELTNIKHLIVEGKPLLLSDMQDRMPFGDARVHEVFNVSLENGVVKITKSMTRLTLGRLKNEGKK